MEKDDRRNGPILTKVESSQIFGNIEEIYQLHLAIAEQLDRALNEDASIGPVFLSNVRSHSFPRLAFPISSAGRRTSASLSTLHEILRQNHPSDPLVGKEQFAFLRLSQDLRT